MRTQTGQNQPFQPMEARNIFLVGVAGFLAYSLLRKGAAATDLLFFPDGIKGFYFKNGSPIVRFGMRVQNTSNQNFTINSFACNVTSNGTTIGNASFFGAQGIAANSQTVLVIEIQLFALSIVQEIINAISTKNFQFPLQLTGTANVDGLVIPVNLNYTAGF